MEELQRAYDEVAMRTGRPPKRILVGRGEATASDIGVVSPEAWREGVRWALREWWGRAPPEEEVVRYMTMPEWCFQGVPVLMRATGC